MVAVVVRDMVLVDDSKSVGACVPEEMVYITWSLRDQGDYEVRIGDRKWIVEFVDRGGRCDVLVNGRRSPDGPYLDHAAARRVAEDAFWRWAVRNSE